MNINQKKLLSLLGLLLSLSPSLVQAHTGSNGMSGWYNGFNHPLHGWYHLLTMLAGGVYFKNQTYWHEKVRTITGLRGDFINNDVTVLDTYTHDPFVNAQNSGNASQALFSPKLSLIIGPWYSTAMFWVRQPTILPTLMTMPIPPEQAVNMAL